MLIGGCKDNSSQDLEESRESLRLEEGLRGEGETCILWIGGSWREAPRRILNPCKALSLLDPNLLPRFHLP